MNGFGRRMKLSEGDARKRFSEVANERKDTIMKLKEKFEDNPDLALGKGKLDELFQKDPKKAENLVMFLEQTENAAFHNPTLIDNMKRYQSLKESARLREDVQTSGFLGVTPMDIVKVARIGYPNSTAPDIFDFWGMQSMKDSLYKLETVIGSTARGSTKDDVVYEKYGDGRYASEYEKETITTSATNTFSGTLDNVPVRPFHLSVILNGEQVAVDTGAGTFAGPALNPSGTNTINYTTGAFVLTFNDALTASDELFIQYAYDSEQPTLFSRTGSVLLDLVVYDYRATPWPLAIEWTRFTEELMASKLGTSAKEQLIAGAGDIFRKGLDEYCITKGLHAAKWATPAVYNADFSAAGSDDPKSHAQFVTNKLMEAKLKTYDQLGRYADKYAIVCDSKAYTYLTNHNQFNAVNAPSKIGIFKVGELLGDDVYLAPNDVIRASSDASTTGKAFIFGKATDNMNVDAAVSVGTWKLGVTTDPVELKNFNSQMGIMSMMDIRINNKYFATRLEIQNIPTM